MAIERIEVQLATPERLYTRVYQDFLNTDLLTTEEKIMFIALKSFVDYRRDEDQVYPSMETLCRLTSMSRPRATRTISSLVKKGIVKKVRRGLTKTNLYVIADYAPMWKAADEEELKMYAETNIPYTTEDLIRELQRRGVMLDKEKEPSTVGAAAGSDELDVFLTTNNCNSHNERSQERYSLENVQDLYNYQVMLSHQQFDKKDIDAAIGILYDVLNTTGSTIRIGKEDKPTMVVIGKLMRLSYEEILYSIKQYNSRTERIGNPRAYLLTILYNAKEQMTLDVTNQVHYDMTNPDGEE